MNKIAIFASGSGTNAQRMLEHFNNHTDIKISLVLSNNPEAKVLSRAESFSVPTFVFNRNDFYNTDLVTTALKNHEIDWVVLAGFLWLVPESILNLYPGKIINIHPALLPKYGGKGMYGMKVHEAVINAQDSESGITIHFADAHYDEGGIIFQSKCAVLPNDTPETLAERIHKLEYTYYSTTVEKLILGK